MIFNKKINNESLSKTEKAISIEEQFLAEKIRPTKKTNVPNEIVLEELLGFTHKVVDPAGFEYDVLDWAIFKSQTDSVAWFNVKFLTGEYAGYIFTDLKPDLVIREDGEGYNVRINKYLSKRIIYHKPTQKEPVSGLVSWVSMKHFITFDDSLNKYEIPEIISLDYLLLMKQAITEQNKIEAKKLYQGSLTKKKIAQDSWN